MLTHYGYDPATGGTTGYPTPEQEQDALELGERVVIELEAERDREAGWPPDPMPVRSTSKEVNRRAAAVGRHRVRPP